MEFHPGKCQKLKITNKTKPISSHEYFIHGIPISETESEKYVGAVIDSKLNWKEQCLFVCCLVVYTGSSMSDCSSAISLSARIWAEPQQQSPQRRVWRVFNKCTFKTQERRFRDPSSGGEVVSKMSKKEEAAEVSNKLASGFTHNSSSFLQSLGLSWAVIIKMEKS